MGGGGGCGRGGVSERGGVRVRGVSVLGIAIDAPLLYQPFTFEY